MKVVVFGSINMDLVVTTPHLPKPGETLTGHTFVTTPGGKGANQAVAAARLGANTVMVGRVGNDVFAADLMSNLEKNGVRVGAVYRDESQSSGIAVIAVEDSGENNIVIIPGANGSVGEDEVARLASIVAENDVLLLQLEVPLPFVAAAARVGKEKGATVILDPAPAQTLPDELLNLADLLTPNETEASILTGVEVQDEATAKEAAQRLIARGAKQVLIKMGGAGGLWFDGANTVMVPAFPVTAVDTVAAGDACNGGLAAALCAGHSLETALRWGMAAGGLATTKPGAQEAMPTLAELRQFLETTP
ncbi:MAG: ribokinase [Chloroflexota bacterium]